MKILIIGSKGFIGQHVYYRFKQNPDYSVVAADIVVDYTDNAYYLINPSIDNFDEIFQLHHFDFCINCSGAASVPDSYKHGLRDFSLNTFNVAKLADAITKNSPNCKLINLSSAAIYGNPATLPINEKTSAAPLSPYGLHKKITEELLQGYYEHFNLKSCSLRIFSAYGPGLKKQLIWDIYTKMKESTNEIELFGTGRETRDFIYISDIVNAINIIIYKAKFEGEVYNIANGEAITVNEIAVMLKSMLNYKGIINYKGNARIGDPLYWQANIDKVKGLGYQQEVPIKKGLAQYVAWATELK